MFKIKIETLILCKKENLIKIICYKLIKIQREYGIHDTNLICPED